MRKMLGAAVAAVFALIAETGIANATCPTWTTLTNSTPADASQVMGNFNWLVQCPNFTGNVGIGTATPAATLDVYGGIDIAGANAISFPLDSTATGAAIERDVALQNASRSSGFRRVASSRTR